jgi:hypothetical protein
MLKSFYTIALIYYTKPWKWIILCFWKQTCSYLYFGVRVKKVEIELKYVISSLEINKKKWYFHLAVVPSIDGSFLWLCLWRQWTILGNFQLPLNYNRLIIYVATFTTYALNFILCPYTLGKKHYIRFAIGVVFLIVFDEYDIIGRGTSFHLQENNYFEESRRFYFTPLIIQFSL